MDPHDFWDQKHAEGDRHALSGYDFSSLNRYHALPVPRGKVVTNIGIGTGATEFELLALGNEVQSVDITSRAFTAVAGRGVHCFLPAFIQLADPADLALCHLVVQHNTTLALRRLFTELPLKPGGILSIQIANCEFPTRLTPMDQAYLRDGLLHFYSPEYFMEFLASIPHLEAKLGPSYAFEEEGIDWWIIRCTARQ